jgi:hypothetical protein
MRHLHISTVEKVMVEMLLDDLLGRWKSTALVLISLEARHGFSTRTQSVWLSSSHQFYLSDLRKRQSIAHVSLRQVSKARAQLARDTHINNRAAAILHKSTWPSNLFFAAPSRATPAGSPAWLPLLRSEHHQHRRKKERDIEAKMLIASCSAPTCSCPPRATRP